MSYESKIIIAKKYESFNEEGKQLAVELATFNLGAAYEISCVLRKNKKANVYLLSDYNEEEIINDKYGEEMTETTAKELVSIIQKMNNPNFKTRMLLSALKEFEIIDGTKTTVLHYGY